MKGTRDELRVRVPDKIAEAIEEWADEKYAGVKNARQLLLTEILREALRRRRNNVRVRKFRQRRAEQ